MKKLMLSIAAIALVAGTVAFANGNNSKKDSTVCPDRPGCICTGHSAQAANGDKDICPNKPGCTCK